MSVLTIQDIAITGLLPAYVAASSGGDKFVNDGRVLFHVKNGSGAPINVTVDSVVLCDQGNDHDIVIGVSAGGDKMIGPFSRRFNDTSNQVSIAYSGVTTLTVAAIRLPSS